MLCNEVLHNKESILYRLHNLEKEVQYELRISYPATTPSEFLIKLLDDEDHSPPSKRRLLNTEKISFVIDKGYNMFAQVTAVRTGHPNSLDSLNNPVVYSIVVERLYVGLTWGAWKLGMITIFAVTLTLKLILPNIITFMEQEIISLQKQNR
ncbi:uncharacterized protein LOC5521338 isoform X2 [Nematostella vectensis]|nr:uncharacterized protein LOC5521338 isoform X2 [Nematostella vectensis]XP_032222349.1 uncharacterized protein LOC5521338 isoform X2 [Nematostella vectensis]